MWFIVGMNWQRLDLNLLKVLKVLLDEQSVTRAAHRLHITPSAVSHALARLRRAFNDPLFVRVGSRMVATAGAEAMTRPLEQLIASLESHLGAEPQSAELFDPAASRRVLRLVSPGALELTLIPALAAALRRDAAGWSLSIEGFERRSYEADLASGRIDFVLAIGGHTPVNEVIAARPLWTDELVVLAGPRSSILDSPDVVTIETVLELPNVYPLPWPTTQNYLDIELGRGDRHRKLMLSLPGYAGVGAAIEASDLVACMPDRSATALRRMHPTLRARHISPPLRSTLSLLWAINGQRDPALNWAGSLIAQVAGQVRSD